MPLATTIIAAAVAAYTAAAGIATIITAAALAATTITAAHSATVATAALATPITTTALAAAAAAAALQPTCSAIGAPSAAATISARPVHAAVDAAACDAATNSLRRQLLVCLEWGMRGRRPQFRRGSLRSRNRLQRLWQPPRSRAARRASHLAVPKRRQLRRRLRGPAPAVLLRPAMRGPDDRPSRRSRLQRGRRSRVMPIRWLWRVRQHRLPSRGQPAQLTATALAAKPAVAATNHATTVGTAISAITSTSHPAATAATKPAVAAAGHAAAAAAASNPADGTATASAANAAVTATRQPATALAKHSRVTLASAAFPTAAHSGWHVGGCRSCNLYAVG